ncbi:lamin tail domain-containing protein [Candidatus Uhrbacteria bacterium]|nr:lamin tail domain-containing protein [Candidatus Uhrbacteria bacterium]
MRQYFFYFFTFFSFFSTSFIFPGTVFAADTDIVITEIAAYEKSDHEWVEIYNKGNTPVDITGWKFFEDNINHALSAFRGDLVIDAGEYAVIADVAANTATDYPSFTGTLIDSSWQTLNEGGEAIALKSGSGAIIEQFTYIAAPDHSLERNNPASADYLGTNWQEHASANSIGAPSSQATQPSPSSLSTPSEVSQQVAPDSSSQSPSATPSLQNSTPASTQSSWKAARGDVVINEFVSDPTDNEKEWVELYNNSNQIIDVGEWTIEDGSKNKIVLKGVLGFGGNSRLAVFESKDSIFNNSGDAIILKDAKGVVIDQVAFGDWNDGMVSNNAPRAQDPASVARFPDGASSFSDAADFKITRTLTKRESNILLEETSQQEKDTPLASSIVINELLANPSSVGTATDEFIELLNQGKEAVDIAGWRLETGSGAVFTIPASNASSSTIVQPQEYRTITRIQSNLALKNQGGDTVRLFQKGKERATMSVTYRGDAPLNQSYARTGEGDYVWTEASTPGKQNSIRKENQPPQAVVFFPPSAHVGEPVTFDATDSRDEDHDELLFFWDFGDGTKGHGVLATHLYREAGAYQVELLLKAGTHEITERRKITIKESTLQEEPQKPFVHASSTIPQNQSSPSSISLTEVFPNPDGRDTDEFIELYNEGSTRVNISGWAVEFQGGKNRSVLPSIDMQPKQYVVISQESGFRQLRNSSEELLLVDSTGSVIDSIDYEDAPSGMSLARTQNGDWAWTSSPTKGKQNLVHMALSKKETRQNRDSSLSKRPQTKKSQTSQQLHTASVKDLSAVKSRTSVNIRGRVTVLPGIFDSTSFYIGDNNQGMLIKSSKGAFPLLSVGQEIEVRGKLSKPSSGPAITIADISDIVILPVPPAAPQPTALSLSAISDSHVGALLSVSGNINTVRWPHIYIKESDKELRIYIKKNTGIPKLPLLAGQTLSVTGILQKTSGDYRLVPREEKDITITASPRVTQEEKKQVYVIPARGPSTREYGTATLVATIVVFGGLMLRSYRRKKLQINEETDNTNLL